MGIMTLAGPHAVVLLQVIVAALLGAAIGLEREISAQPAGLRTHMLVCLGSALFTLVGADAVHTDPTRIAAQVVTGIGFLGAGAILRSGPRVHGLTTAASLWVTAAIGLAVGMRQWYAAAFTTGIALVVLMLVRLFERRLLPGRQKVEIVLTLEAGAALDEVITRVCGIVPRSKVLGVSYDAVGQQVVLAAQPAATDELVTLAEHLRTLDRVRGVAVNR
jgi:putative Mg2+ transporter-C (MgtC) family protein